MKEINQKEALDNYLTYLETATPVVDMAVLRAMNNCPAGWTMSMDIWINGELDYHYDSNELIKHDFHYEPPSVRDRTDL